MSKLYFFLCIYLISSLSIYGAAEETRQEIPTYIDLPIPLISGDEAFVRIPLSKKELLTGKTFEKLAQRSFEKGMPLALVTSLCKSPSGFFTETVDLCALFHTWATWNTEEMTDGDRISIRLKEAMDRYVLSVCKDGVCHDTRCVAGANLVGPLYMIMRNTQSAALSPVTIDGRTTIFKNHNLVSLLLMYTSIKDVELKKRISRMFLEVYVMMLKEEKDPDMREQLSYCHQMLLAYWAGNRKKGIKHYKSL